MAAVGDFVAYIQELEKRVRALETVGPIKPKGVFCQEGNITGGDATVIDVGFKPSQVAVYGATYNPNMSQGSRVQIQDQHGPKYLLIAVE